MHRTAIILNPAARGERASALVEEIRELARDEADLLLTREKGEARQLARQAVAQGYTRIVAAGGDGTINEVVNGLAGSNAALGLLPTGTMNVFAKELGLPKNLRACWEIIREGHTREIDLPLANGHAFVQLAGIGLDAQIVQETSWTSKKAFGPLSYLLCATQVAMRKPPRLKVHGTLPHSAAYVEHEGSFVLLGNGRYYGGPFPIFRKACLDDRCLDVLIFKNLGILDVIRYLQNIAIGTHLHLKDVVYFQAESLSVSSDDGDIPVEVDGEVIGHLPVAISFHPKRLRVLSAKALPERSVKTLKK